MVGTPGVFMGAFRLPFAAHSLMRAFVHIRPPLALLAICKLFLFPSLPACISCIHGRHSERERERERELIPERFKTSQFTLGSASGALRTEWLKLFATSSRIGLVVAGFLLILPLSQLNLPKRNSKPDQRPSTSSHLLGLSRTGCDAFCPIITAEDQVHVRLL